MKVSRIVQENIAYMNELLPVQESYDIVERDIVIGGRESCFLPSLPSLTGLVLRQVASLPSAPSVLTARFPEKAI